MQNHARILRQVVRRLFSGRPHVYRDLRLLTDARVHDTARALQADQVIGASSWHAASDRDSRRARQRRVKVGNQAGDDIAKRRDNRHGLAPSRVYRLRQNFAGSFRVPGFMCGRNDVRVDARLAGVAGDFHALPGLAGDTTGTLHKVALNPAALEP